MKFIASMLVGSSRSINLILYCLVVLLIARDHLVLSKALFRSSQQYNGGLEETATSDDLVDYSDRQTAQISSTEQQQQSDSGLKINGLLEKYLISSSSSTSKRRKQYAKTLSDIEGDYDSSNNNWNSEDQQKTEINRLASRSSNSNGQNEQQNEHLHTLVKKFRTPNTNKRAWDIQTYYDILLQNDGSILLIPKDVNKNHYFIG